MSKHVALNDIYLFVLTVYLHNDYMIAHQMSNLKIMALHWWW